jgi:hypothetical protein
LLFSCSAKRTMVLQQDYEEVSVRKSSLGIAFQKDFLTIEDSEIIEQVVGTENPDAVFERMFANALRVNVRRSSSYASVKLFDNPTEIPNAIHRNLKVTVPLGLILSRKESLKIKLPKKGEMILDGRHLYDYVLLVGPVVSREKAIISHDHTNYFWEINMRYAIWDNNKKQLVAYGYEAMWENDSFSSSFFSSAYDQHTFRLNMKGLVHKIFEKTPMRNPYIYESD